MSLPRDFLQTIKRYADAKELEMMNNQNEVKIYIMGKLYQVPKGLTIMKAIEYSGYKYIRGAGCRSGFCGACATIYRKEGDLR